MCRVRSDVLSIFLFLCFSVGIGFSGRHCAGRVGRRTSDLRFRGRGRRRDRAHQRKTRIPRRAEEIQRQIRENRRKLYSEWLDSSVEDQTGIHESHNHRATDDHGGNRLFGLPTGCPGGSRTVPRTAGRDLRARRRRRHHDTRRLIREQRIYRRRRGDRISGSTVGLRHRHPYESVNRSTVDRVCDR